MNLVVEWPAWVALVVIVSVEGMLGKLGKGWGLGVSGAFLLDFPTVMVGGWLRDAIDLVIVMVLKVVSMMALRCFGLYLLHMQLSKKDDAQFEVRRQF